MLKMSGGRAIYGGVSGGSFQEPSAAGANFLETFLQTWNEFLHIFFERRLFTHALKIERMCLGRVGAGYFQPRRFAPANGLMGLLLILHDRSSP